MVVLELEDPYDGMPYLGRFKNICIKSMSHHCAERKGTWKSTPSIERTTRFDSIVSHTRT
jgi:hypothetical protein